MGLHSSLKRAEKLGGTRSVMKRPERLKWLQEKGQWNETNKVLGLPKIKVVKLKAIKKEKAAKAADSTTAAAPTTDAAAPAPKTKETPKK